MLRKQSKKLAIMLVLSMIASLFVGVGAASAANGVAVSVSRVISAEGDAGKLAIGSLQIKEDSDYKDAFMASGDSFVVTLPSSLKWDKDVYDPKSPNYNPDAVPYGTNDDGENADIEVTFSGNYTMTVTVYGTDLKDAYTIPMYVNFDGVEDGYAYATIDPLDSPVPGGDYAVANILGGGTSATVVDDFTAGPDTSAEFTFRLTETTVGTFSDAGNERVKLTLPSDVTIDSVEVIGLGGFSGSATEANFSKLEDNKAEFYLNQLGSVTYTEVGDSSRGILEFTVSVSIDDDASEGDVTLDIDGEDAVDDASIKVGTIAEYGVTLSVDDPVTVLAGRVCQELGTIVVYENVADTISSNRTLTVTLPDGVKFAGKDIVSADDTKGTADFKVSNDESEATIRFNDINPKSRLKLEIEMDDLNIRSDFRGDIVATIGGRAGVEGEVVLGTVVAPVEMTISNVADVKIGYQAQAIGDITITETEAGAMLEDGIVEVNMPSGVAFTDDDVTVEVTEGNLEITSVKVNAPTDKRNGRISFKVDSESSASQPGTVTISGLAVDVDRTVAEGPVRAILTGNAIVWSYEGNYHKSPVDSEYDVDINDDGHETDYVFDEDEMGRYAVANCVTPGVAEVVGGAEDATSTFVIGSTAASIAGADVTMPVAPYITNSRTQLPVRYVAYACGVPEANVIWNPDNQTVTLLNNNGTVVQLTIGSTSMLVNGVAVVMDVAPEITGGYTFLPARYVANAFNYDAAWEAATQTVTITPIN